MQDEIKKYIDIAIKKTLDEAKRRGMMKETGDIIYAEASEIIAGFYKQGLKDASIFYAIQEKRFDAYFKIIPMYYKDGKTIEAIAEEFDVDVSTIVRNKKRLCIEIYKCIT